MFRVVLVLGRKQRTGRLVRFARRPVKPVHDRVRDFEQLAARIEAQLAVLEEDTERTADGGSPAGLRLRTRRLAVTRALLAVHLRAAIKLCRGPAVLASLQQHLAAVAPPLGDGPDEAPPIHFDQADLAAASINLERLADMLFLYHEVHGRLMPSRSGKDGKGREEGVA